MVAYSDVNQGISGGQFKTDLALPFWSVGFSMDAGRRNFLPAAPGKVLLRHHHYHHNQR